MPLVDFSARRVVVGRSAASTVLFTDFRSAGRRVVGWGLGTHQGEYMGLPPTGKSVTYNEIFIVRFAGGRVAETWGVVDVFSQMKQLGDEPTFHAPVFVVTHRPAETIVKRGGTSYIFVTEGIEHALVRAREAAGSDDVQVNGGADIARQYLELGRSRSCACISCP